MGHGQREQVARRRGRSGGVGESEGWSGRWTYEFVRVRRLLNESFEGGHEKDSKMKRRCKIFLFFLNVICWLIPLLFKSFYVCPGWRCRFGSTNRQTGIAFERPTDRGGHQGRRRTFRGLYKTTAIGGVTGADTSDEASMSHNVRRISFTYQIVEKKIGRVNKIKT